MVCAGGLAVVRKLAVLAAIVVVLGLMFWSGWHNLRERARGDAAYAGQDRDANEELAGV